MTTVAQTQFQAAFRTQVEALVARIKAGNKQAHDELLKLIADVTNELGTELVERTVKDLLDEAAMAYTAAAEVEQQDAERETEEKTEPRQYTDKESRDNAARILREKVFPKNPDLREHPDIVKVPGVLEMFSLMAENAKLREWASVLSGAMNANENGYLINGWIRDTMRRTRWQALETAVSRKLHAFLMMAHRAEDNLGSVKTSSIGVARDFMKFGREAVEEAKEIRWNRDDLQALQRMITGETVIERNPVSELLEGDRTLVPSPEDKKPAKSFLQTLQNRLDEMLVSAENDLRQKEEQATKNRAEKELAKTGRRISDQEYRRAMKGHNPEPPKYGKGKNR